MEGIKCIINGTGERTQQGEEVRAVLRYLVTVIRRPTDCKAMMARPTLQSLGQDALPPPGRLEMPTVDGAAASFARRSAALRLSVSCHFRMNNSAPSYTHRKHLPAF